MVEQLVRFLGVSYDKAQLESMVEHCHQLIDQCCNAEALPVGRGMFKTHSKTLLREVARSRLVTSRVCQMLAKYCHVKDGRELTVGAVWGLGSFKIKSGRSGRKGWRNPRLTVQFQTALSESLCLASMDSALHAENSALLLLTFGMPKPMPSHTVYPGLSPRV